MLSKADLPHIQWSLTLFLGTLVMSATTLVSSDIYLAYAQRNHQTAQHQLSEAHSRLAAAQDDHQNIATYAQEYATLLDRKIIGNDQRLDWIEGMEKIRQQNHVLEFKYAISPQQHYTPILPLNNGNFELNLSGVTLQFDLLHEEQLINFFNALNKDVKGHFILDHCTMERSGIASGNANASTQNLKAECSGGWLTLNNRKVPP